MPVFHIQPQDLLFFRDARPMESQSPSGGHGARWPHPAVFFDALHAALWRGFPNAAAKQQRQFTSHTFYRKENGRRVPRGNGGVFFQTLTTAGPFPVRDGQWLFSAPADVQPDGGLLLPITTRRGDSDLPKPLHSALGSATLPSKETVSPWWSKPSIEPYLTGRPKPRDDQRFDNADLFTGEWTTGIGMDPATETQDGERIYSAQYLRLRDEVRMGLWASLPKESGDEGMDDLFPRNDPAHILLAGGQQRVCRVERQNTDDLTTLLPVSQPLEPGGKRLKWVLLSPAIFPPVPQQKHPGGWLPTWVHPADGAVLLTRTATSPKNGKLRQERRHSEGKELMAQCHLVAACIPKPVPITGWTEALHVPKQDPRKRGPRETLLAVRSGAVYYFECETDTAAQALWELLSWHGVQTHGVSRIVHRRSSVMGEKGFGLGVCGPWKSFEESHNNS
jgi:CRISPR-associated protein Cmr3